PLGAQSAADSVTVQFGAFVDAYHAFDVNRPVARDRAFTTQPARHNEFNVNLAYVEATVSGPRVRARFAAQFGTSVQANYLGEPRIGAFSGHDVARFIQEAVVGVKVSEHLWIDGGIHLSHIGSESWISRDNLTYTRSMIADYSPYYQSGVKLTWQALPTLTMHVNVVNGWQNISETNGDKAIGGRIDWAVSPQATLSVYNLIGNEAPDSVDSQLRLFQGASLKLAPIRGVTVLGTFDVGTQDRGDENSSWYGGALIARVQASPRVAFVGRLETYHDRDQVIIVTGGDPMRATGGSFGVDVVPAPRVLWRTEARAMSNSGAIFPDRDGVSTRNAFVVSSLAVTF
ncbi:MAG: outer membrane beta-barrel protein, partial [Gemmatimonadaceae bacterium]